VVYCVILTVVSERVNKISKIFVFSVPFANFPQFCTGPQILNRVADSAQNIVRAELQNLDIPTFDTVQQCFVPKTSDTIFHQLFKIKHFV